MRYKKLKEHIEQCRILYVKVRYSGVETAYVKADKKDVLLTIDSIDEFNISNGIEYFEYEATVSKDIGKGFDVYMGNN